MFHSPQKVDAKVTPEALNAIMLDEIAGRLADITQMIYSQLPIDGVVGDAIKLKNDLLNGAYIPAAMIGGDSGIDLGITRVDEPYSVDGDTISASTDGTLDGVKVRLNVALSPLVPLAYFNPYRQSFFKVYLTNTAQPGKTLYLLAGKKGSSATDLNRLDVNITTQTITKLAVDIVAQTIATLKIDIASQSIGNVAVNLAAQTIGNLAVNIAAQTVGNLNVNVAAQAGNLNVNIAAQAANVNITLQAQNIAIIGAGDWAAQHASLVSMTGSGGSYQPYLVPNTIISYTVPAGKIFYLTDLDFTAYDNTAGGSGSISVLSDATLILAYRVFSPVANQTTSMNRIFSTPIAFAAGTVLTVVIELLGSVYQEMFIAYVNLVGHT